VQAQVELARQAVLIRAYLQDYVRPNPVTTPKSRLNTRRSSPSWATRNTRLATSSSRRKKRPRPSSPSSTRARSSTKLAKQSKDPGSKDKGGDLGWANPAGFVKPFCRRLTKLEKGKYTTTPVKSDFGYHVIKLEDSRPVKAPSFDEVKGQLKQRLEQQRVERHIAELRTKATVK
jgi:peptidyl-prolyl cis-trans isomerase C